MDTSKGSVIMLVVLGIVVVLSAAGQALTEWEWWLFLLILSSLAFVVGLVAFAVGELLRKGAARS